MKLVALSFWFVLSYCAVWVLSVLESKRLKGMIYSNILSYQAFITCSSGKFHSDLSIHLSLLLLVWFGALKCFYKLCKQQHI
jgi:hypothetical protein